MPHELCGILNSRPVPALSSGPPKGPEAFRVSAIRQGVAATNCNPDVGREVCVTTRIPPHDCRKPTLHPLMVPMACTVIVCVPVVTAALSMGPLLCSGFRKGVVVTTDPSKETTKLTLEQAGGEVATVIVSGPACVTVTGVEK